MKNIALQSLLNKNLQIFLMCCELRNFSEVGRVLGLTQSAISKAIQNFENELGLTLFIRDCRPLTLTAEAVQLEKYLRVMMGDFKKFMGELQSDNFIKPILRIGILDSLATTLGVEIVKELLPDVSKTVIVSADAQELKRRLLERKVDIIITHETYDSVRAISHQKLFDEPGVLVLPKTIAEQAEKWTWDRLAHCGLPLISYSHETGAGNISNQFLKANTLFFPERVVVDNSAMLIGLVKQGIGWAFTQPTTVLSMAHELDDIVIAPMQEPVMTREVCLMGREGEFTAEVPLIKDVAQRSFEQKIFPEIFAFAPWLVNQLSIKQ